MQPVTRPTKQPVREYMERRTHAEDAPPTPEEIGRQLGWDLIPENKHPDQADKD